MGKDKGSGIGSIYYNRQREKWNAQYSEYDAEKDEYVIKTKSFKTKEEAEKFQSTIMYQRSNPIFIENNGIPLGEMMRSILQLKLDSNQISSTQYGRVLRTIEQIEKYPIGKKRIDEITSTEIQVYLNAQKHLSNSTLLKLFGQFNQTFKVAMNRGYIMKNPMIDVLKPKSEKETKNVRALTVEEQQEFTAYLMSKNVEKCKYKNVFLLQMYCGLRIGEALALSRGDIDLNNRMINIHRTLTTDEMGGIIMGNSTKTYAGRRVVPIPEFIMPHIIEQMRKSENQEYNDEHLVFKPEGRRYTNRVNVNDELKRMLKKYFGITDITTHSLRHTFGTRCIESGMAPVVVQRLMGHTDVLITLNTYTSVFDKYKASEVEKVNQYYLQQNISTIEEIGNRLLGTKETEIEDE